MITKRKRFGNLLRSFESLGEVRRSKAGREIVYVWVSEASGAVEERKLRSVCNLKTDLLIEAIRRVGEECERWHNRERYEWGDHPEALLEMLYQELGSRVGA